MRKFLILILFLIIVQNGFAQGDLDGETSVSGESQNEINFTHTLSLKLATQLDLGTSFSNDSVDNSIFKHHTQNAIRGWVHYYPSARFKLSGFFGIWQNLQVDEIGQRKYVEYRTALQGIYYYRKPHLTLSNRVRFEDRHIENKEGDFWGIYRFRYQLKTVVPINGKQIRKGIAYGIVFDELYFSPNAHTLNYQNFEQNRFSAGIGYSLTEDIQIEVAYILNSKFRLNQPDETVHALSFTLSFNNLIDQLKKKKKDEKL